jgi:hypothetical protein
LRAVRAARVFRVGVLATLDFSNPPNYLGLHLLETLHFGDGSRICILFCKRTALPQIGLNGIQPVHQVLKFPRQQSSQGASSERRLGAAKQLACQSRGPPATRKAVFPVPGPATRAPRTAVFPIADVLAGLALTNRSIVLAIVAIRIFSMAVWIEARAGGLLCRTHQRSTYQERIVQALAESGTPVKD